MLGNPCRKREMPATKPSIDAATGFRARPPHRSGRQYVVVDAADTLVAFSLP